MIFLIERLITKKLINSKERLEEIIFVELKAFTSYFPWQKYIFYNLSLIKLMRLKAISIIYYSLINISYILLYEIT